MEELLDSYGLVVLFGLLAVHAAGIPGPPGKTALVAAAILAARGHFPIADSVTGEVLFSPADAASISSRLPSSRGPRL